MRISFDLDDTLVIYHPDALLERTTPWWWRWRFNEPLRQGTTALLRTLQSQGHELWVYTTSYREPRYVCAWFRSIGVRLVDVVNQDRHDLVMPKFKFPGYVPSKYPPAFGIDLHVDDSAGVGEEGGTHGFRVVVVSPTDTAWTDRVLAAVASQCEA